MNKIGVFNKTILNLKEHIEVAKGIAEETLINQKIADAELNVVFVSKTKIKKINKEYRGKNTVTDVISFALEEGKPILAGTTRILGDIYIAPQIAKKNAKKYGHSLKRELAFLTIHGVLHLLGYDHQEETEEQRMIEKQEEILNGKNITRKS